MAESMVSSPQAPPSPPSELTPRSKIAALMAAVGSDSESDGNKTYNGGVQTRQPMAERDANAQERPRPETIPSGPFDDEDSDSDDVVPRGNIARRLHGASTIPRSTSLFDGGIDDKENAYARVRKQLFGGKRSPKLGKDYDEPTKEAPPVSLETSPQTLDQLAPNHEAEDASPSRLFFTPSPVVHNRHAAGVESDEESLASPEKASKFLALVAKQTEKRKAKEAEEKARKEQAMTEKTVDHGARSDFASGSESDELDQVIAARLTQQTDRPARKASKKALEEMNRETQRISRNMQLAHQAKTKKKITKESLLARFQFGAGTLPIPIATGQGEPSNTASSEPPSGREDAANHETPPTSPSYAPETEPVQLKIATAQMVAMDASQVETASKTASMEDIPVATNDPVDDADDEADLPDLKDVLNGVCGAEPKGKGNAVVQKTPLAGDMVKTQKYEFKHRPVKIRLGQQHDQTSDIALDSEEDLKVAISKPLKRSRLDVFQRIPKAENVDRRSLRTLRALAHLDSPPSKRGIPAKYQNSIQMQMSLHQRARQQALEERSAKIEELKAKGIFIQTAEEREREQVEVEDLLEKARKENEEIREKEKRAAKKAKAAGAEDLDPADLSSDEDEDYRENDDEESELEASGSEDEEENGMPDQELEDEGVTSDDEGIEERVQGQNDFIEGEAADDSRDEAEIEADADLEQDDSFDDGEDEEVDRAVSRPRRRPAYAILDDDDEDETVPTRVRSVPITPVQTNSAVDNIPAIFQNKSDAISLGLTQAFAATMANTQADNQMVTASATIFESPPEPVLPSPAVLPREDSMQMVPSTQEQATALEPVAVLTAHDDACEESLDIMQGVEQDVAGTQGFELPDPTQDQGFGFSSPGPEQRFVSEPPSTVATVIVADPPLHASPAVKRRGRLQRRSHVATASDNEESNTPDAFETMKRKRKADAEKEKFNKKKSGAKEMVEEQAQESEDEYAGLGGASDEDSNEEDEEFVREMIDQGDVNVDERKLAALHADKQRTDDNKAIEKLYKDITNGGLRRKRRSDFDVSDSEDEKQDAIRKRKQREFAKMRKAMMQDANVSKIAEDPKKLAFLRAIEDREDGEAFDFLDGKGAHDSFYVDMDTQEGADSQAGQQEQATEETEAGGAAESVRSTKSSTNNMRPPPSKRRTSATGKRPSTLAEIKQSVSALCEEPGSFQLPSSDSDSESEKEDEDAMSHVSDSQRSQDAPQRNPRRTGSSSSAVVDRLLRKRQSTSSLSSLASDNSTGSLAFHNPSTASSSSSSFVPSLLRRATTNSSLNGVVEGGAATTERAAGGEKAVKVNVGKKISVNFRKREGVKERIVRRGERKKREEREKMANQGRALGGLAKARWDD